MKKIAADPKKTFFLIAGPCVLESQALAMSIAKELVGLTADLGIPFVFKASFDKANRTSGKSFRGPGLAQGLKILGTIKKKFGCPVLTDIHDVAQVKTAAKVIDILQIPAFLCRQTDLLVAAAKSGRTVNVKKGQFLAPEDVNNIAAKLRASGAKDYFITERGTTFGYHNLVVDMRGLAIMRHAGHRVVFDATHSVQRPGGQGTSTGGDRTMAPVLARAAVAAGIDGLFLETHPRPDDSPSDGPNMIPLAQMEGLLRNLKLSMRRPVLSWGLGACVMLASVALAQNAGNGANQMRLPVGQTFKQFTFPVYGPDGVLRYSFFATEATGVTLNRAEAEDLRIEVYENGLKTTTITSPKADLYVAEQKMRTKNTVQIVRNDMEATSQDCDFDVKAKVFFLRTNVKVLLKHFDVGAGSPGTPKKTPAAPGPLPGVAPSTPVPGNAHPMPTDESILPSPGSYSDTNSVPLPPGSTSR